MLSLGDVGRGTGRELEETKSLRLPTCSDVEGDGTDPIELLRPSIQVFGRLEAIVLCVLGLSLDDLVGNGVRSWFKGTQRLRSRKRSSSVARLSPDALAKAAYVEARTR